ncbi:hypothetical protein PAPYR_11772 [Paratrimastix pyriformis]|uniref:Uncharacterized protein n=1 Tax=Paratrimastix pyriformis TaxID=342808 RepID=A0ABQ8U7X9_9EUKA|nr:hypothetical protein PAPYR_11772 [Paratrimastix pyriformis]
MIESRKIKSPGPVRKSTRGTCPAELEALRNEDAALDVQFQQEQAAVADLVGWKTSGHCFLTFIITRDIRNLRTMPTRP